MGVIAPAVPYNVTGTGAVFVGMCIIKGLSIRDTAGITNTVRIYDNASAASGTVIFTCQLASLQSIIPLSIDGGIRAANGLYISATGAIEGSLWIG